MQIELIRNATLRLTYGGRQLLIDPCLASKHSLPTYAGHSRNPTIELPDAPEQVLANVELVLISHLHADHFEPVAQEMLGAEVPLLCQPEDEPLIREMGFEHVQPVATSLTWNGITITRTPGQHGSSPSVLDDMGTVSGFVFEATDEPTVYWAGDTILYDDVVQMINNHRPDVIITHSCGAMWGDNELIVMDDAQTIDICRASPSSVVIATHMEALDHATVTRQMLADAAIQANLPDGQLRIPQDGEVIFINRPMDTNLHT